MGKIPKLPIMLESAEPRFFGTPSVAEARRRYMRTKLMSVKTLVFQGAVLATLLLAAGARWKAN